MRIAIISDGECVGGAEVAATRLCDGLRRRDDVVVQRFVARRDRPYSESLPFTAPTVPRQVLECVDYWLGMAENPIENAVRKRAVRRSLLRLVAEFKPDIINLHGLNQWSKTGLRREVAAHLSQLAPVVWTLHDMWPLTGCCDYLEACHGGAHCGWKARERSLDGTRTPSRPWSEEERLLAACEGQLVFVSPSKWLQRLARESFGGRLRSECIPYGLDTDEYYPLDPLAARAALGLASDARIILAVGTHTEAARKGFDLLAEAGRNVGEGTVTIVVGARRGGAQVAWAPQTVLVEPVSDVRLMRQYYSAADVVAVPSREDNLPNVMLEALACGTPCVGFAVGGIPDAVREGVSGWVVESADAAALAKSLCNVMHLSDADTRNLRASCRRLATEEYTLDRQASRYVHLFSELLQAAP